LPKLIAATGTPVVADAADGADGAGVVVDADGVCTIIFVVLPVCTVSRTSSISVLYSFAVISLLSTPNCLFNKFDIRDQLEFIKNTSSADVNDFTISFI
jgi:hypothetical protein